MSGMGKSGKRPDHIEEALHRAARSAKDVSHLQQSQLIVWCRCAALEMKCVSINVGQSPKKLVWDYLIGVYI